MHVSIKKIIGVVIILGIAILGVVWYERRRPEPPPDPNSIVRQPSPKNTPTLEPRTSKKLDVPYISEAPSGNWTSPWKNACEEASIAMVEFYYQDRKFVTIKEAETFMMMLFQKQNEKYGDNVNSDSEQFKYLIDTVTSFRAEIVRNPTIEQIKEEIDDDRPVISLHYGYELHNPNIPFLRTGTYYHAMVIIGYDDAARQFIVNDDGDTKTGAGHRYGYDLFMNSLHEYQHTTGKADGLPTVLFTSTL